MDHFEVLQNNIYSFSRKGDVILCGDFNARIGGLDDFVDQDDLNFSNSIIESNINPRNSRDGVVNTYGRALVDLCCGNDLVVLNGRMKGDSLGQLTCHTYNGASVAE